MIYLYFPHSLVKVILNLNKNKEKLIKMTEKVKVKKILITLINLIFNK
ncbi:hypothetical protein [Mycoplasma phage sp.]|nr:hypothetical protein [Mycoplasma phage sp.]